MCPEISDTPLDLPPQYLRGEARPCGPYHHACTHRRSEARTWGGTLSMCARFTQEDQGGSKLCLLAEMAYSAVQKAVRPWPSARGQSRCEQSAQAWHPEETGVWARSRRLGGFIDLERPDNREPSGEHVNWMPRVKKKGVLADTQTARCTGVSVRCIQELWSKYLRKRAPKDTATEEMGGDLHAKTQVELLAVYHNTAGRHNGFYSHATGYGSVFPLRGQFRPHKDKARHARQPVYHGRGDCP